MLLDGHGHSLKLGDDVVLFARIVGSQMTVDGANLIVEIYGTHARRRREADERNPAVLRLKVPSCCTVLDSVDFLSEPTPQEPVVVKVRGQSKTQRKKLKLA